MSHVDIVLVDNCKEIRQTVSKWTESLGFKIETFINAESLYSFLVDVNSTTGMFLIDDDLPGRSCLDLIEDIRATRRNRDTPIFLLCNVFNSNFMDISLKYGVNGWFKKPLQLSEISNLMEEVKQGNIHTLEFTKLDFTPNLGRLNISWDGKKIRCKGAMDEHSWFDRIAYLIPTYVKDVKIDWSGLSTITSKGIECWHKFWVDYKDRDWTFTFHNCSNLFIDYINFLNESFPPNLTIFNAIVDVFDSKRLKVEQIDVKLSNNVSRNIESVNKELLVTEHMELVSDLDYLFYYLHRKRPKVKSFWYTYMLFFNAVNHNTLMKIILSKETLLDQTSCVTARFVNFDKAISLLDDTYNPEAITRSEIIEIVLEQYKPAFQLFDSISLVVQGLSLKWNRKKAVSTGAGEILRIISDSDIEFCQKVSKALHTYHVDKLESNYLFDPSEENLIKLTVASFSALRGVFVLMIKDIELVGQQIINLLKRVYITAERIELVQQKKSSYEFTKELELEFQSTALLWWQSKHGGSKLVDQACEMLSDMDADLEKIVVQLHSHDLVSQLLTHRINEIDLLIKGCTEEEFHQRAQINLVTVFEKKAYTFYYGEVLKPIQQIKGLEWLHEIDEKNSA